MRRVSLLLPLVCSIVLAAAAGEAADKQIVYVVRHAERADAGSPDAKMTTADPPLSAVGRARAERLAAMLRSAKIKQVFTTELVRTRQTAAPTAAEAHVEPIVVPSKDLDDLVGRITKTKGPTLVVGHSNTVPDILKKLGVSESVHVGNQDFDDLFIVVRGAADAVTLVRLKY